VQASILVRTVRVPRGGASFDTDLRLELNQLGHFCERAESRARRLCCCSICIAVRMLIQSGSHGDALPHVDCVPVCLRPEDYTYELGSERDALVARAALVRVAPPALSVPCSGRDGPFVMGRERSVTCEAIQDRSGAAIACPVCIHVKRYRKPAVPPRDPRHPVVERDRPRTNHPSSSSTPLVAFSVVQKYLRRTQSHTISPRRCMHDQIAVPSLPTKPHGLEKVRM